MNDFALASNRTVTVDDTIVRQFVMSELDQFIQYAHPIREAIRNNVEVTQAFIQHSAEAVALIQMLTNADIGLISNEPAKALQLMLAIHQLNIAFFDEKEPPKRKKTNDKSTWFDGFQFLISNGHQHSQIMQYTYGAYLGYVKAAGRSHRQSIRMAAIAARNAQHATKQGFDKFERELSKE